MSGAASPLAAGIFVCLRIIAPHALDRRSRSDRRSLHRRVVAQPAEGAVARHGARDDAGRCTCRPARGHAAAQPRRLGSGLSLGLVAPGVSNLDRAFDAELYFDDHGLRQVLLQPTRLLAEPAAMREFEELRHAASLRYGRELPGTSTPSAEVLAEARWRAGPVTVMLRVEKRGALAAVTMTYEADKDLS